MTSLPQGDPRLLDTDTAARLLASTELARVAYTAGDGGPRLFPMMFHWTGSELVLPTFAGAAKIAGITARPLLAVTIDTAGFPPEVLQLRGRAEVVAVDGVVEEYLLAHRRYGGPEQEAAVRAELAPDVRMARISLRPTWVGVLDFQERFPGGTTAEQFANRGRA